MSLLGLSEVSFSWSPRDEDVLSGVSLCLDPGEMLGIVGPNGGGKSTLLSICAGLLTPTCGTVELLGEPLTKRSPKEAARLVALVPQDLSVPFSFTVEELVLMGRAPHLGSLGMERREDVEIVERALEDVELGPLARRPLDRLSGGERQRAFIARAMAQQPRVLLCDEPTAHLDLRHQAALFRILRERAASNGLAVMVVLHDLNLAAFTCDRLILLDAGAVAASGPPRDVVDQSVLERVYGTPMTVGIDPESGRPFVLPSLSTLRPGGENDQVGA